MEREEGLENVIRLYSDTEIAISPSKASVVRPYFKEKVACSPQSKGRFGFSGNLVVGLLKL